MVGIAQGDSATRASRRAIIQSSNGTVFRTIPQPLQDRRRFPWGGGYRIPCSRPLRARIGNCRTDPRAGWWPRGDDGQLHVGPARGGHVACTSLPSAARFSLPRVCGARGAVVVRSFVARQLSARLDLCRSHPQGDQAERIARAGAGAVPASGERQDRQGARPRTAVIVLLARRRGDRVKRRKFITLLGGAAAAWPLAARAQQAQRMRRIGVLLPFSADDAESQVRMGAFLQTLALSGWSIGRNLRIDIRWAGINADDIRRHAAELAALAPDVIIAHGASTVRPLQQATRSVPIVFPIVGDPVGAGIVRQ